MRRGYPSQLIAGLIETFEPGEFRDEHREAVMSLIKARAEGVEPERAEPIEPGETGDPEAALRASLDRQKEKP